MADEHAMMEARALMDFATDIHEDMSQESRLMSAAHKSLRSSQVRVETGLRGITECSRYLRITETQVQVMANEAVNAWTESSLKNAVSLNVLEGPSVAGVVPEYSRSFFRVLPNFSYSTKQQLSKVPIVPLHVRIEQWDWIVKCEQKIEQQSNSRTSKVKSPNPAIPATNPQSPPHSVSVQSAQLSEE